MRVWDVICPGGTTLWGVSTCHDHLWNFHFLTGSRVKLEFLVRLLKPQWIYHQSYFRRPPPSWRFLQWWAEMQQYMRLVSHSKKQPPLYGSTTYHFMEHLKEDTSEFLCINETHFNLNRWFIYFSSTNICVYENIVVLWQGHGLTVVSALSLASSGKTQFLRSPAVRNQDMNLQQWNGCRVAGLSARGVLCKRDVAN